MQDLLELQPHRVSESLTDKIFLFYGEAGTRKTTVAGAFPDMLLSAFEIGYKYIDGIYALHITNWSEFKRLVRKLDDENVKEKYKMIGIDTISLAYSACYDYILKQQGVDDPGDIGYGKGWRLIRKEFEKTILKIPQIGYGLVMIAHADENNKGEDASSTKVDIDKRPAAIIKGLADHIIYLRKAYKDGTEKTMENQTVYAYTNLVDIESKTRLKQLAPKFEFTYENLKEEIKKAIEKKKVQEGIVTDENRQQLYKKTEQSFEEVREEAVAIAKQLISENGEDIKEYINNLIFDYLGVPISETTKAHKNELISLREELADKREELSE
jgi:hypothetical protein